MALSRIQTAEIADNAVTTVKVDDATVIGTDIVDGTITNTMVAAGAAIAHTKCAVGPVAVLDVGTTANKILQLDGSGNLPALDGTQLTGIVSDFTPLENQMSRLGLHLGAVGQLTKFNMIDQVIDDYEDATGVVAYNGVAVIPAVAALADHSSSGRTVTAVGGIAISTTQKQFGTHGIFFDGSNDHLTIPAHTDFNFAGDFTFECWVYWDGSSSELCNIDAGGGGGSRDFRLFFEGTKFKAVMQDLSVDAYMDNASIIPVNTWTHIAAVRSGNTITGYGNGVAMNNPLTTNSNAIAGTSTLHIGGAGDNYYSGYMDEIRLSNTARYTSAFTPSTTEFVPDSNTLLLLHSNAVSASAAVPNTGSSSSAELQGSTGAKYYEGQADAVAAVAAVGAYQDASSSAHTVTATGTVTATTGSKKIGTHGIDFNTATNGYLTIAAHADFQFGTGDFEMSAWLYQKSRCAGENPIISNRVTGGTYTEDWALYTRGSTNKLQLNDSGVVVMTANTTLSLNTWVHVMLSRVGNTLYLFQDGVQVATTTQAHNYNEINPVNFGYDSIGTPHSSNCGGNANMFHGYMDEILIKKGAGTNSAFSPPTSAHTADSNTKLLLHGEAIAAAAAIPASTSMSLVSTTTTAKSTATKASIVLQTEDETGTATINTDVKVGVSRDALNYISTPLTKISTWGSGNVYAANDVTIGPGLVMDTKDVKVATAATILFAYTGADVNWTVPPGVATATIIAWGAGGGGGSSGGYGGGGGYISGDISVTAGETLVVKVGGKGVHNTPSPLTGVGQGGGGTGIYRSGTVLAIAGAGGGSASSHYGGAGGGTTGGDGAGTYKGLGGTQSAGGAGGAAAGGRPAGNAGSLNQGGHGVLGGIATTNPAAYNGGGQGGGDLVNYTTTGGGGGYYGGGSGGSGANGSGGGGSSLTAGTNTQATTYTPAQTGHANYPGGNVGYGGAAGVDGVAGYMVIKTTVASTQFVADDALAPTLELTEGYTYKFDTSDSSNSGHTFKFATAADAAGSTQYTTGVTESGTPGSANAYTQIAIAASAPTLYYYCSNHASMGGQANTPTEASTTSMRYRIDTKNQSGSKVTRVHGTSLAWS